MNTLWRWLIAPLVPLAGIALAQSPFVDVSPCHWATEAVAGISGQPQVDEAQARASTYLAENALRQVFEGLKCGELGWSAKFMSGTPQGTVPVGSLTGFDLSSSAVDLSGDEGTVSFALAATIDGEQFTRDGSAALVFSDGRWQVRYASLAALGLPIFP